MALEEISTEPIVKKLRNLREYMPDGGETLYKFGEFLADRLSRHSTLVPQGFNIAAELGIYDLQNGIDGFTGKPIQGELVGYPSQVYDLLRMSVPDLADAVCPEDFAKGVRKRYDEINKNLRDKK